MSDCRCNDCEWEGEWGDLAIPEGCMVTVCPECKSVDVEDTDAVGPEDYQEQERGSSWK